MYAGLARAMGRTAAWTLTQLLRTGNGHAPFSGPDVTAAEVLHLYAVLRRHLTDDTAWYLVDVLREMNGGGFRTGPSGPTTSRDATPQEWNNDDR